MTGQYKTSGKFSLEFLGDYGQGNYWEIWDGEQEIIFSPEDISDLIKLLKYAEANTGDSLKSILGQRIEYEED